MIFSTQPEQPTPEPQRDDPPSPVEDAIRARLNLVSRGISPAIFSEISGMSTETCRRYQRGDTPSLLFVARMCFAMGVSCDWLILGRGKPCFPDEQATPFPSKSDAERHLEDLARLLAELRNQAAIRAEPLGASEFTMPKEPEETVTPTPRQIRLLLGPADGCTLTLDVEPADEVRVLVDLASGEAQLAIHDQAPANPHQTLCRYRRVLPTVYRWIDPVREYA